MKSGRLTTEYLMARLSGEDIKLPVTMATDFTIRRSTGKKEARNFPNLFIAK